MSLKLEVDLMDDAAVARLATIVAALSGGAPVSVPTETPKPRKEKPAADAKPQTKAVIAEGESGTAGAGAEPEVKQQVQAATKHLDAPDAPKVTREDAAKMVLKVNKEKGRAAAVALLEKFRDKANAEGEPEVKVSMLKPEAYAPLVAEGVKILAAEGA